MEKPFASIADAVLNGPCLFWGLALSFSAYYGWRAFLIERQALDTQNQNLKAANGLPPDAQTIPLRGRTWGPRERWVVHYIQSIIFNVVGSLVGWGALRVLCYLYLNIDFSQISAGASAMVIFLVLAAVNGISGTLPHLTMLGRLFGGK